MNALASLVGFAQSFSTRAAFVTWAATLPIGGVLPAVGTVASAAGFSYRYIGTGTLISDLPGWVPHGDIWLDHWGPDLTGATDDNAKITAFFTYINGKTGNLPAGIINWTQQSGAIGVMATGTIVRGQGIGATIMRMNVPSTAFARAFQWQNPRIVMRDFTFIFPTLANCTPSLANLSAGDGMLERVRFEGGVTGSPTASHTAIVMNGSTTANFSNFTFKDCEFDKVSEALEKGNTATAIHKNFKFVGCRFSDCHSLGLALNSPSGDVDGVIISNLIAENTTAHGATNMAIGVATGHNISVLGAVIKGPWWVAVHLEQNVRNASFVGITAEIDGDFFDCTSNNIGGTWYRPEQVSLTGFAAEKTGTRGTSVGIRLTFDGNTISSADSIVISNGVLKNFATGVRVGTRADDDVRISNLDIINCDTGIYYTADGFLDAKEITFKGCTTAVLAAKGGILEGPTFSNCTNTHTVTAGALEMVDPKFNLGSQVFTAAQTRFFHLLRNVTRATSKVSLRAYNTGTHRHTVLYQMDWDGTTETATSIHSMTGGGTITCLPAWVDGALTVAVTAGGTGYTVGDVLSVAGGTLESTGNRTTATVATVSSGVVTGVTLTTYGEWATPPANAAATTGGTGTGCTLTLTYGKTLCAKVFDSAAHTDFIEVAVSGSIFVQ